jgi:hypothetical protein
MVEVHVHGRDREIVMIMLQVSQPIGQLSFMVVIDV